MLPTGWRGGTTKGIFQKGTFFHFLRKYICSSLEAFFAQEVILCQLYCSEENENFLKYIPLFLVSSFFPLCYNTTIFLAISFVSTENMFISIVFIVPSRPCKFVECFRVFFFCCRIDGFSTAKRFKWLDKGFRVSSIYFEWKKLRHCLGNWGCQLPTKKGSFLGLIYAQRVWFIYYKHENCVINWIF